MNTKTATLSLSALLTLLFALWSPHTGAAEPATWSLWKNRLDSHTQCAQTAPGKNWDNMEGRFGDPHCRAPLSPAAAIGTTATTQPVRNSPADMGRKSRILELMTIFATARSSP